MKTPLAAIALCAGVMVVSACDKTAPAPPKPVVSMPAPAESGFTAGPAIDPSLPSAASVFPSGTAAQVDPAPGKTDGTRKPAQESAGVLMPGQNNDHSAPLSPAK